VKYLQDDSSNTKYQLIVFTTWPILPFTKIVNEVQDVRLDSWSSFSTPFDQLLSCLKIGFG
jgi:hypothetical protein